MEPDFIFRRHVNSESEKKDARTTKLRLRAESFLYELKNRRLTQLNDQQSTSGRKSSAKQEPWKSAVSQRFVSDMHVCVFVNLENMGNARALPESTMA
jgi:hypothetical protein